MMEHISAAAEAHAPDDWVVMPSGAGHDAQRIAEVMPAAMLFVPSIKGISHNFDEDTAAEDLVLGCQVYTDAAAAMLLQAHAKAAAGGWTRRVAAHEPWIPRPLPAAAEASVVTSNAQVVEDDRDALTRIELSLGTPAVREWLEAEVAAALAALSTPNPPPKYSKEFAVPPELRAALPPEVQTVRVFGLAPGEVMRVYERHPNSVQRTRVVVGEGTWHVRESDGSWYSDTVGAAGLGEIAVDGAEADCERLLEALKRHTHVVPAGVLHFVENRSGAGGGIHVNLTWHSAAAVEDVIVSWEEEAAAASAIDTYHVAEGFHAQAPRL